MNVPRKTVSKALFQLCTRAYKFNYTERRGEVPMDVAANTTPAFYLVRPFEDQKQTQAYGLGKYDLHYGGLVYLLRDQVRGDLQFLDIIDDILDGFDQAMLRTNPDGTPKPPNVPQMLVSNGTPLVQNAWIDGTVHILPGILGKFTTITIPLHVITGI